MKILIVEDEPSLQELIKQTLKKDWYVVECTSSYQSTIRKIEDYEYDCILLDIMLPDGNGLSILETLKKMQKQDSVIIISAKDALEDKIAGLELGADDYLAKPFHLTELVVRIRSVIRRKQHDGNMAIETGYVKIYPEAFKVTVNDSDIDLNRKEYDILFYFVNRNNQLINKHTLAESVWGDHIDNFDFIYAQ